MLFVVLLHLPLGDRHVPVDFFAHHTPRKQAVLVLQLQIFNAFARLLADPGVELVRFGLATGTLHICNPAVHVGIDIDVHVLALLHQQQLIDLVTEGVGRDSGDRLVERSPCQALLGGFGLDESLRRSQFSASDDLAVDLGDDFFNHLNVCSAVGCGCTAGQ